LWQGYLRQNITQILIFLQPSWAKLYLAEHMGGEKGGREGFSVVGGGWEVA